MTAAFVDLHCHLLPALDDGPADDELAVALARALVADGVGTVAATPHRTTRLATPLDELADRLAALRNLLAREQVPLDVIGGAECAVDAVMDMDATEIQALRLGGHGPLLVELPQSVVAGDPTWPVLALLDAGTPVLLAHPERIPFFQNNLGALRTLIERGAWSQLTSGALLGRYGPVAHVSALEMLDAGLVSVLASDAHHPTLRPPETTAALAWLASARPAVDGAALTVHTPRVLFAPSPAGP